MNKYLEKVFNKLWLTPLFNVKSVADCTTYMPVIFPLLGLLGVIKRRSIAFYTKLFMVLPLYSLLVGLIFKSSIVLVRSCQLLGIVLFVELLTERINKKFIEKFVDVTLLVSLIVILFEFFFTDLLKVHYLSDFLRFRAIIGEPNYSAYFYLCVLGVADVYGIKARNRWFLAIFTILTMSRMGALGVVIYPLLKLMKRFYKQVTYLSLIILISYPLVLFSVNKMISAEQKAHFANAQTRYYLHNLHVRAFLKRPFGNGFFGTKRRFARYIEKNLDNIKTEFQLDEVERSEQHNASIQVLTDFGIIIYIYVAVIILFFLRKIDLEKVYIPVVLSCFCAFFLNSLNELGFCLVVATTLSTLPKREAYNAM